MSLKPDVWVTLEEDAELLSGRDRLRASTGVQFFKQAFGVGIYGVFANEEPLGDLLVAKPAGDELQNL